MPRRVTKREIQGREYSIGAYLIPLILNVIWRLLKEHTDGLTRLAIIAKLPWNPSDLVPKEKQQLNLIIDDLLSKGYIARRNGLIFHGPKFAYIDNHIIDGIAADTVERLQYCSGIERVVDLRFVIAKRCDYSDFSRPAPLLVIEECPDLEMFGTDNYCLTYNLRKGVILLGGGVGDEMEIQGVKDDEREVRQDEHFVLVGDAIRKAREKN